MSKRVGKKVKNWIVDSFSGINVAQKVQSAIRKVFGIDRGSDSPPTELEKSLVSTVDQIIRKGRSPATLFDDETVWEGFEVIAQQFGTEKTVIKVNGNTGRTFAQDLPIFQTIRQLALTTRAEEKKIEEYRRGLASATGLLNRKRLQQQIADLGAKIGERAALIQKIIFTEADRIESFGSHRQLRKDGHIVRLDDFLADGTQKSPQSDLEKKASQETMTKRKDARPRPTEAASLPPMPQPEQRSKPEEERMMPDVLNWNEIQKCGQGSDSSDPDHSFRLDF